MGQGSRPSRARAARWPGTACIVAAVIAACLSLLGSPATAQPPPEEALFIRNHANPSLFLSVDAGLPVAAPIDAAVLSGLWLLEPLPDEPLVRIRNREQNTYLHTQNGVLELSDIEQDWVTATWQIEPVEGSSYVRIRNAATGLYLTLQEITGPVGVAPLDPSGEDQNPDAPPFGAPPPGQPSDQAPATIEWEFIRAEQPPT